MANFSTTTKQKGTNTNALPAGCNVLSVHKMGDFRYAHEHETKAKLNTANVAIRYDQTKIQRDDTRLELWRYVEAEGKWSRLVRLDPGERPASKVIAMPDGETVTGNLDEEYNIGTFAVVEREPRGGMFIVR